MITIIDYGLGNARSILAKLHQFGEESSISNNISDIECADKLILPGVGSFNAGIHNLEALGIIIYLKEQIIKKKIPVLGICLGMQLFGRMSEEGPGNGLSFFDANTTKFHFEPGLGLHIPHMGWNTIKIQKESILLDNIPNNSRFYFVHSFHLKSNETNDVVATTHYGYDFPSILERETIFGVQFHPEKSHVQGIQLLKNFVKS